MPHKRAKASIRQANSLRLGFDLPPSQHQAKKSKRRKRDKYGRTTNQTNEEIPKNMFRILNAEKIRAEYRQRKIQNQASSSSTETTDPTHSIYKKSPNKSENTSKSKDGLKILPCESLSNFNRRVEETLRPEVTTVMRSAKNKSDQKIKELKKVKGVSSEAAKNQSSNQKLGVDSKDGSGKPNSPGPSEKPVKDFAPRPSKFPLLDTVMEPPSLLLTKSMKKYTSSSSKNSNNRTPLPISAAQKKTLELERAKVIEHYRKLKEERQAQL